MTDDKAAAAENCRGFFRLGTKRGMCSVTRNAKRVEWVYRCFVGTPYLLVIEAASSRILSLVSQQLLADHQAIDMATDYKSFLAAEVLSESKIVRRLFSPLSKHLCSIRV